MPIVSTLCAVLTAVASLLVLPTPAQAARPARCLSECAPRIGIVSAFGAEADILLAQTTGRHVWNINGNRYTTGSLEGKPVVIVLSGVGMVNAAMSTQLMLDHFRIRRLILSGIAGGINPANNVGDVVVPEKWAAPMEVYWNGDESVPAACGKPGDVGCLGLQLAHGADGQPLPPVRLGNTPTGQFLRDTYVMNVDTSPQGEYRFDFAADVEMLAVARTLQPGLEKCGPHTPVQCVSAQPQLRVGGRGVSSNAFLANPDYREYLSRSIQAELMDMETTAFAQVAYANKIPFIAFRSVSDLAGDNDFKDVGAFFGSGLAETNEAKVTLAFLRAWKEVPSSKKPAGTSARQTGEKSGQP